ncbi:hypothetical protein [Streptomyces sp. NBC_00637]|uniref:hypothetical protein n=1 Tax=Streptomyces sp. NBC_00637 TaxID=2903667 RepID=UPI002F90A790
MSAHRRRGMWMVIAGAVAALVLGIATTLSLAATGALRGAVPAGWQASGARCGVPALPGHVVQVTESDMGPGMMGGTPGRYGMGMMRLVAHPGTASAA